MLVGVIRLRLDGTKLPEGEIKAAEPVRGDLVIVTNRAFDGQGEIRRTTYAKLESPAGAELLPHLRAAVVTAVSGDSIVVTGTEAQNGKIGSTFECPQTWWCRLVAPASFGQRKPV